MLDILYEDDDILVLEKPCGVPVQSAAIGVMDLESKAKNYLSLQDIGQGAPYLGIVHRLDQPVGGVLVFAKTPSAAAELSAQAADGRMKKKYLAVVCGKPVQEQGVLVDYLLRDGRTNTSRIVEKGRKGAKRAELHYRLRQAGREYSLLEVRLVTGRHHQIRVQMAGADMPLFGDQKYNPGCPKERTRIGLYACSLSLHHPSSGKEMEFTCAPKGGPFETF